MFTGIIENLSEIKEIVEEGDNLSISFYSNITDELKIDQSVSHNGICLTVENGSWYFDFEYDKSDNLTIEKGSIAINGVSLTVVNSNENTFSVAIIPYTYNHTNFKNISIGDLVNLEFDMIGKYISKIIKNQS